MKKLIFLTFLIISSLLIAFSAQAAPIYTINPGAAGSLCSGNYPGRACAPATQTSINIPTAGNYSVSVRVERGNNIDLYECQGKEDFYMIINGQRTPVIRDPDACERSGTIRTQNVSGTYSLRGGANTIQLFHARAGEQNIGIESLNVRLISFDLITAVPTCSMSAAPTTINAGQSTVLSWSSTNTASVSINQGIGSVAISGSRSVSPSATTTYTGTFTGAGGTVTCTATVTVVPRPNAPTCSMSADPTNINAGQGSSLRWSSTNTTSVSINQGIGSVAISGSRSISPSATTTYTGTFTGAGGTVTCAATIIVNNILPPPTPTPTPTPSDDDDDDDDDDDADCEGSIGDYIWNDEDGDGKQDENEKGLANIRVKLTNFTNDDESTLYTTKNGKYEFKDLCDGEYRVTVKKQDVEQYTQTYDPDGTKNNKTEVRLRGHDDHHRKADFGYKGRSVAPRTGSGTTAIYLSVLISLAGLAAYMKVRKARSCAQK